MMLRQGDQQQSFAHLGKATCFLKKENKMGWFLSDISCSYTFLFKMNFRFLVVCCVVVMPFFQGNLPIFFQNISTALELGFHVVNQNLEPPKSLLKMVDLTDC